MLGAIIGDIIGSRFERNPTKNKKFKLFTEESHYTDDSCMTIATMHSLIMGGKRGYSYKDMYQLYGLSNPDAGYGISFKEWIVNPVPYNSWGNGSAMRVSPIGWFFNTEREVLKEAKKSAEVSHNHKEGIKGAQAIALAVFYARKGKSKTFIKEQIEKRFKYDLNRSTNEIKKTYTFDVSCQGSVPEAIICFLESNSFLDAIRRAVALGGDADTLGAMAGSISGAFYQKTSLNIINQIHSYLPSDFLYIIKQFEKQVGIKILG